MEKRQLLIVGVSALWLAIVVAGIAILWGHALSQGVAGHSPTEWPAGSRISHASDRAMLVMLAHPHCPWTRASIRELALLMARRQTRIRTEVLFYKPSGLAENWEKTDLWESAAAIPGVEVIGDEDGIEAQRFGAETSGQVALYDGEGGLLFSGGITFSRGHSGDNDGRSAIVSLLNQSTAEQTEPPVFGCPLLDESAKRDGGSNPCSR